MHDDHDGQDADEAVDGGSGAGGAALPVAPRVRRALPLVRAAPAPARDACCEAGTCEAAGGDVALVPAAAKAADPSRRRYKVSGLDCGEEVAALKAALRGMVDPEVLRFDLLAGVME